MKTKADAIIGAIGGDIIGSVYEFRGARHEDIEFFKDGCRFTDDTVLTIAVADWLTMHEWTISKYLINYGRKYSSQVGYGPSFTQWLKSSNPTPYNSCGNGSAMRVSAVGCVADCVEEAMELAKASAMPTHNHPEGVKGAQAIAVAIYMARHKMGKNMIKAFLSSKFDYDFNRSYKEIYDLEYSFNVLCQTTVPEALICFFESNSYEDCIKKAMLTNKDTDTAAAIAGAVAGAYYGIADDFKKRVLSYLPEEFVKVIENYDEDDVVGRKTIVYLHGFGSSGQSGTVKHLRKLMPEYGVLAPDIPVNPAEAQTYLKNYCEVHHPDLIIGTSMGAMYAMQLYDYRRICVNPALRMSELTDILKPGTFEYFQPTLEGETHFTVTDETIQQFREMEANMYEGLTDESRRWCWGFFGDEDTTVDCKQEFLRQFFPNVQMFHGGHRMTNKILEEVILPFAKMMLEEDYTDEWGVTYSNYGRILKEVNKQLFTCEEYSIPEGVEVMKGTFWLTDNTLRKIHLPSTLREMEVNTFICCPLEELELPEGITEVPEFMCESCRELKKVTLPSTVQEILNGAFNCCTKLSEINLPNSIYFIDSSVFRCCESLKSVKLPPNIGEIRSELFYGSGIETIDIHEKITYIGYWAFWGCDNLKRLVIPETVKHIDYGIVSAHNGFEGVVCHAKGYHVENDALIDDERQELLCCWTQQKNYVVPDCVRRIADIGGNEFVETITANQPIELTTYDVFASDINLKRIDFLAGVIDLNKQNFWNCPKLELKK